MHDNSLGPTQHRFVSHGKKTCRDSCRWSCFDATFNALFPIVEVRLHYCHNGFVSFVFVDSIGVSMSSTVHKQTFPQEILSFFSSAHGKSFLAQRQFFHFFCRRSAPEDFLHFKLFISNGKTRKQVHLPMRKRQIEPDCRASPLFSEQTVKNILFFVFAPPTRWRTRKNSGICSCNDVLRVQLPFELRRRHRISTVVKTDEPHLCVSVTTQVHLSRRSVRGHRRLHHRLLSNILDQKC